MARKGKATEPLVIYDADQAGTAGSYKVNSENKVSFSELGLARGDNALDIVKIQEKLGNIKHNGSVQIFLHGDGLGKIVIGRRELTRKNLFSMLANAVNIRPDLYPTCAITEVLLLACGGGNNPDDIPSYQEALNLARQDYPNSPIQDQIHFVSPLFWYQFGVGSIKMFDSGERNRPIVGTNILLDKLLTRDSLKPNQYYYKTQLI